MSKFERHVSEIVETESSGSVEPRYSSPPGGHFAALQMLEDGGSLDLLVLEATGKVQNSVHVYRRVGVLKLLHIHESNAASPDTIAALEKLEESRIARLSPRKQQWENQKICNDVIRELQRDPWEIVTVTIV